MIWGLLLRIPARLMRSCCVAGVSKLEDVPGRNGIHVSHRGMEVLGMRPSRYEDCLLSSDKEKGLRLTWTENPGV